MIFKDFGKPESPIWFVVYEPYDNDAGIVFDGSYGYHFHKMAAEAGLQGQYYVTSLKKDNAVTYDDEIATDDFCKEANRYHPPLLGVLGQKVGGLLLPQIKSFKKPYTPRIESFAGSLLKCSRLNYEHYAVCTHPPDVIIGHWDYRDILVNIDFGRIREELAYFRDKGCLNPLPVYDIICAPSYEMLMEKYLDGEFKNAKYLSSDIETIRPRQKTTQLFKGNPGYPYLLGLADSSKRAVSFSFWDYTDTQAVYIWKAVDKLLSSVPQIGQNYFNFDAHYLEALGFTLCLDMAHDTLIRHHILWPELAHSLQFQTKQYTRQPYYKDEGKGINVKNQGQKQQFMRYNGIDCCVTYAVHDEQEAEFNERPHLK